MKNKKSQFNQVFVYLLSIITILFVGFLVVKFIFSFTNIVDSSLDSKLFSKLETDYSKIYTSYDSEEIFKYRVSKEVKLICFANKIKNCNIVKSKISNLAYNNFNLSLNSKENIGLFGKNDLLISKKFPPLNIKNNCLCIIPNSKGIFSIILSNIKNKVWIKENK